MPTYYTTKAKIEAILGPTPTRVRVDDNGNAIVDSTEAGWIDEAIAEATDTINLYVQGIYSASQLVTSTLVNRWAAYIACNRLSIRRGNPDLYSGMEAKILELLERIKSLEMFIPGLTTMHDLSPALSNLVIDPRIPGTSIRVVGPSSTGGNEGIENPDISQINNGYYWI